MEVRNTELEDGEIVRRVLAGEEDLFEVLVRRYQVRVVSHVTRMVGNRDDALDLAQEIFLKVFQALDRFNPAYKFSTWLFRIAGNAAIDHLRKRRPRTVPLETPDPDGAPGPVPGRAAVELARPLRAAAKHRARRGHPPGDPGAPPRFSGTHRSPALRRAILRGDRRGQEHAPRDGQEQTLSRQSRIEGQVGWRSDVKPCPRPLDPIDAEAVAAGAEPLFAADAAAHARECAPCQGLIAAARDLSEALEGALEPAEAAPGLADRVTRLRAFSRRERRTYALWNTPVLLTTGLSVAGLALLALPALTATEQVSLGAAALTPAPRAGPFGRRLGVRPPAPRADRPRGPVGRHAAGGIARDRCPSAPAAAGLRPSAGPRARPPSVDAAGSPPHRRASRSSSPEASPGPRPPAPSRRCGATSSCRRPCPAVWSPCSRTFGSRRGSRAT